MSVLTALIFRSRNILAGIQFTFLKNIWYQTWKAFHTKLGPHWKDRKSTYQVDELYKLALFYKLVTLTLVFSIIKKAQNIADTIVEAKSAR